MKKFIGRADEIRTLTEALASGDPELVAVFGRRRVGKTYLIRHVYTKHTVFEFSGIRGTSAGKQLERFQLALAKTFGAGVPASLPSWLHAFDALSEQVEKLPKRTKKVVFLDEFPWMDSPRSAILALAFNRLINNYMFFLVISR